MNYPFEQYMGWTLNLPIFREDNNKHFFLSYEFVTKEESTFNVHNGIVHSNSRTYGCFIQYIKT